MIFGNDRNALRRMYATAWQRAQQALPLTPLDDQIVAVIREHPEYHALVERQLGADAPDDEATSSAFMHMGLHLAVREQVATNRPAGIRDAFRRLSARAGDAHTAEHRVTEILSELLWDAQRAGRAPDEAAYLDRLRVLAGGGGRSQT